MYINTWVDGSGEKYVLLLLISGWLITFQRSPIVALYEATGNESILISAEECCYCYKDPSYVYQ